MGVQTAAGAKLFIGPVAADTIDTEGEYSGLTYEEVGEIENLGEFGDQVNQITFTALANRRVRKFKGSFDAGNLQLTLGRDTGDDGQADLRVALADDANYAFKIELGDGGNGSPATDPTTFYFRAKVMSYTTNVGSVENVVRANTTLAIDSEIVEVAAG